MSGRQDYGDYNADNDNATPLTENNDQGGMNNVSPDLQGSGDALASVPQRGIYTTIYKTRKPLKERKKYPKICESDQLTLTIKEFGVVLSQDRERLDSNVSDDEKASVMSDERVTAGGPAKPISGVTPKCQQFSELTKVPKSLPGEGRKVTFYAGNDVKNRKGFYDTKSRGSKAQEDENEILYGLPVAVLPEGSDMINVIQGYDSAGDKSEGMVIGDSVEIIFCGRSDKADNVLDLGCDSAEKTERYGFNADVRDKYGIGKDDIMYVDAFLGQYIQGDVSAKQGSCAVCCTLL